MIQENNDQQGIGQQPSCFKMKCSPLFSVFLFCAALLLCSFALSRKDKKPTLFLIGDSTVKNGKGKGELVKPIDYIKNRSERLWKIETDRGSINQCLSLNHNFAYVSSKGNINKKPFIDVIKTHNSTVQGFYGKVITSFEFDGNGRLS